DYMPMSPK
nr:Chain P, Insulin receptor substrate 1 [Rattus norvegicus]